MKKLRIIGQIVCAVIILTSVTANACTRFIYETGNKTFVVGRSMDWMEDPKTDLWAFPQGMKRDGGLGQSSMEIRFGDRILL